MSLAKSDEALASSMPTVPSIPPVPAGERRPFWSVMIPTYNCAKYLRQTLESVLAQDPGTDLMQIEVVDDVSTKDNPESVVQEIGKGRVSFFRQPINLGATKNFNSCIQRAVGHWVHILHGDDYVLPGFYEQLHSLAKINANAALIGTRCFEVDEAGGIDRLNPRTPTLEAFSQDTSPFLYEGNPFRTPSSVVSRSFYERHGGFCEQLCHVADWELWVRAIQHNGGCVTNTPLACYRNFGANDTSRLARTGENVRDFLRLGETFAICNSQFDAKRFRSWIAEVARHQLCHFAARHDGEAVAAHQALIQEQFPTSSSSTVRRILGTIKRRLLFHGPN